MPRGRGKRRDRKETFERQPIDLGKFPSKLKKHVDPESPKPMKMMAADGMLPAPPEHMIKVLYQLHFDSDSDVTEAVQSSVADMPENVLAQAAQKESVDGVLDWLAEARGDSNTIGEVIVRNQATDDLTVARMASNANAHLGDVIATNQVRVLRTPRIIEELYQNPNIGSATIDSLIELAQRNDVELDGLPGLNAALKTGKNLTSGDDGTGEEFSAILKEEAEKAAEEDEKLDKLNDDSLTRSQKEQLEKELAEEDDAEEQEEEEDDRPMYARIGDMNVGEKIRLATVGSREAIKLLVKDTNKLVHMAAIQSPRLNKGDIKKMSANKSLPDGVIEYIANNRDWASDYEIRKNLVMNPKSPLSEVLNFLNHLRANDLREVARSRSIPHQVARQAKQLLRKRRGS